MDQVPGLIAFAVVLFAATDIDDLFVLVGFFADPKFGVRAVVAGQFAGIAALYGISVVAALIALVIPAAYIGLLGLVPIWLGAKALWARWRPEGGDDGCGDAPIPAAAAGIAKMMVVAGVTIANGGDNIGVYTPVFAIHSGWEVALMGGVFAVMTGLWCWLAHALVSHRTVGAPIRRYGPPLVPFVLIALGVWILWEAGTVKSFLGLDSA